MADEAFNLPGGYSPAIGAAPLISVDYPIPGGESPALGEAPLIATDLPLPGGYAKAVGAVPLITGGYEIKFAAQGTDGYDFFYKEALDPDDEIIFPLQTVRGDLLLTIVDLGAGGVNSDCIIYATNDTLARVMAGTAEYVELVSPFSLTVPVSLSSCLYTALKIQVSPIKGPFSVIIRQRRTDRRG